MEAGTKSMEVPGGSVGKHTIEVSKSGFWVQEKSKGWLTAWLVGISERQIGDRREQEQWRSGEEKSRGRRLCYSVLSQTVKGDNLGIGFEVHGLGFGRVSSGWRPFNYTLKTMLTLTASGPLLELQKTIHEAQMFLRLLWLFSNGQLILGDCRKNKC